MEKTAFKRWAIRAAKLFFFLLLFFATGRILGDPYSWVNDSIASKFAEMIYDYVGGEELDDAYFYINVTTAALIAGLIYLVAATVFKKLWRKGNN